MSLISFNQVSGKTVPNFMNNQEQLVNQETSEKYIEIRFTSDQKLIPLCRAFRVLLNEK